MLLWILPMMLFPLVMPVFVRLFGKKNILMYSTGLGTIFSIAFYFVGYENLTLVFVFTLLKGIAMAPMIMVGLFTSDLIEYGHFTTGKRAEAMAFSIQTFATKLQGSISGLIGGWALVFIGYQPNVPQTAEAIQGLWYLNTLIPILSGVVLMLIIGFFYKLNEDDVKRYIEANSKKNKATGISK
jgi:Na+/melibiose symporter-like transporter